MFYFLLCFLSLVASKNTFGQTEDQNWGPADAVALPARRLGAHLRSHPPAAAEARRDRPRGARRGGPRGQPGLGNAADGPQTTGRSDQNHRISDPWALKKIWRKVFYWPWFLFGQKHLIFTEHVLLIEFVPRNDVNEFGFTPLTLDFEAFVRFIRQVG